MHVVPNRLVSDAGALLVEWRAGDGGRFGEPFFEETLARYRRDGGALTTTPLAALEAGGADPAALVFHVSRCGSTLVSRMLAALPGHLAVSEAPIFDDLLRQDVGDEGRRIRLLRGAAEAMVASQAEQTDRLFIKLDCWHIFHLDLLRRAFPTAALLFVHRDPVEVAVSLMRMPGLTLVRGVVTPVQLGLTVDARNALAREENVAAILGAFFREAAAHREALTSIPYADLPGVLLDSVPDLTLSADDRALMLAAAGRDAKSPGQTFTPDAATKRAEADPAVLEAVARLAEPQYRRWLGTCTSVRVPGQATDAEGDTH